jgi:hypothetical protein
MRSLSALLPWVALLSCTEPSTTPLKLASGVEVRLLGAGPLKFGDGSSALMVRYVSDLVIADSPELRAEAAAVFGAMRSEAEKQGLGSVVVSANSPSKGIMSKGRGFNFVFRQAPDGQWSPVGGSSARKPTITKLKFGKMSLVNGRQDVSEETTDIPLVHGRMSSATDFEYVYGPCLEFTDAPNTPHSWILVRPAAGNPMPAGVEVQDGKFKVPLRVVGTNYLCIANYFTPGDRPGDWTFDLYFDSALVKTWTVHVTEPTVPPRPW